MVDGIFARRLRMTRESAGLTQQQLADRMSMRGDKMHRSTIGKIEAGERTVSAGEGFTLAEVLGVDMAELLTVRPSDAEREREHRRHVEAQIQVRALLYELTERRRLADEAQILYDNTATRLEAARRRLQQIEVEHKTWQEKTEDGVHP